MKMSKAVKRKSGSCGPASRSLSVAREKRPSVFERLGTKPHAGDVTRAPRRPLYHASCSPSPSHPNQLPSHAVGSAVKRTAKKEGDTRPSVERAGSPDLDWTDWDQSELEYQDEKALERRRQLLQRELELQMNTDTSSKHSNSNKKRSSSSSSCSSSSSAASSTSSSSSSHKLDTKKNYPVSPDRTSKKLSKMVYKESSPGRKSSMSKKSPSRKMYKKSLSPSLAASSRKSPTKRLLSRKKEVDSRDRSRVRSGSRERRRGRSKEAGRHRQRAPLPPHPPVRGSERKKEDERGRRGEERRDRRSDPRDPRRDIGEDIRMRDKMRDKERCRQGSREGRRDKCSRSSRSGRRGSRAKEPAFRQHDPPSSARHSPLSPNYHHHYRPQGERSRYGGSSERERVGGYKEPSPRDQDPRMRLQHPPSTAYQDSGRVRRRGWEGSRYDSPKTSTRDWDSQHAERIQEWQRSSKHNQDKDYVSMDKDKDLDWKRGGGSGRGEGEGDESGVGGKRARLEEPPPPPPPPPIIEPDLSDISDDPDDILNRDDGEDLGVETRGDGPEEMTDSVKEEESQPPLSTASSNLEHRLLDQRIGEDEGVDSLVFEEISDEDLEEESKNNKGSDVLVEDWESFIAECRGEKKGGDGEVSSGKPWDTDNILRRVGVSRLYAGEQLYDSIQRRLTQNGGEGLLSDVGGLQSAMLERRHRLAASKSNKIAISARSDLAFRRQLCGLPVVGIETFPLYQYQTV